MRYFAIGFIAGILALAYFFQPAMQLVELPNVTGVAPYCSKVDPNSFSHCLDDRPFDETEASSLSF